MKKEKRRTCPFRKFLGIFKCSCNKDRCQLWTNLYNLDQDGKTVLDEAGKPKMDGNCSLVWSVLLTIETKSAITSLAAQDIPKV